MMKCVSKTRKCVSKTMNFYIYNDDCCSAQLFPKLLPHQQLLMVPVRFQPLLCFVQFAALKSTEKALKKH